jgi:alginate O-acetyltransferase complex protein AlgI
MSLLSPEFAAFVAIAALLFHAAPLRARPALLCTASLVFCALNSFAAAVALFVSTAIAFYTARSMDRVADERLRRRLLCAGVAVLLTHLVLIKLIPLLSFSGQGRWAPALVAAFGASYYTLKLVSYLADIFWRRYLASSNPVNFAAFAAFFPLLPAGPIQRVNEFELPADSPEIAGLVVYGLRRILLGLVKKLLVADRLGGLVQYIGASQPDHANVLWVMAYLFPVQLYADFSALTDIAIGVAAVFGVRAPENFAFPFFASTISEFWRRWHMSLTRWLGDYVFTPMRMATRGFGNVGLAASIVANMVLIGMWHAISYGWLIFGLMNALFLIVDVLTMRFRRRIYKMRPSAALLASLIGPILVFHLIALSLVCFRAQTLPDVAYFFGHLFDGLNAPGNALRRLFFSYGRGPCAYVFFALCGFMLFEAALYLRARRWMPLSRIRHFDEMPRAARWAVYYAALLAVGIANQQSSRFIYVQF